MNPIRTIMRYLRGDDIGIVTTSVTDLLADCLRPRGDPKRKRHYYGRTIGPTPRMGACIHCGSPYHGGAR